VPGHLHYSEEGIFNSIDIKWYKYCRLYSIVSITEYEGIV